MVTNVFVNVFVLVKQTWDDFFSKDVLEVEVFPTKADAIQDVYEQYFQDIKSLTAEDEKFWDEVSKALNESGEYLDNDGNDPIHWHIYER